MYIYLRSNVPTTNHWQSTESLSNPLNWVFNLHLCKSANIFFQTEDQQWQHLYWISALYVCEQFLRHVGTHLIAISYSILKLASPPPRKERLFSNCSVWKSVFTKPKERKQRANIIINCRRCDSNRVWFSRKMSTLSQTTAEHR